VAPRAPVSARRALLIRLAVAPAVLGGLLLLLFWHDRTGRSTSTDVVLALFGGAAAYEAAVLLRKAGKAPDVATGVALSAALCALGLLAPDDPAARGVARSLLLAAAVGAAFATHLRAVRPGDLDRLLATLFPVVYVGFLFGLVRELGDGPLGARRIALVVLASKASDIGGWVVGKTLGRHKMIPSVSPGKTWEGTAGGLAFSVVAAVLLAPALGVVEPPVSTTARAAVLGLLLGAASIAAGLTQSALKRRCGVKDSSALLPEMGGILDMVDSVLFAAPVAWLWYRLLG
jgi:phosphatidate cytidylyltransferase